MGLNVEAQSNGHLMIKFSDTSTVASFRFEQQEFDGKAATQAFVHIFAPILRNVPASEELFKWIAIAGTGYRLGTVEAFEEEGGTIFLHYRYALLADFLDEDELSTAMWAVLGTADRLDDELKEKFGGKRWIDGDELLDA
jgi:hypothetical protein